MPSEHPADEYDETAADPSVELWQRTVSLGLGVASQSVPRRRGGSSQPAMDRPGAVSGLSGSSGDGLRELKGAVASAMTEFLRWRRQTALSENPGQIELAYHLLRITYNRLKRRLRADRKLQRAAAYGQSVLEDDGRTLLAALSDDTSPRREEFVRHFREVVGLILEGLNDRDRTIVRLFLERETHETIAARVGCHRATVFRVIDRFRDRFRRILGDEMAL